MANLALEALLEDDAGAAGREARDVFGLGLPLGNAHALEQLDEHAVVKGLIEGDPVLLLNPTAGVADFLAELAVVGEDDQPFAVGVEAADIVGVAIFGRQEVVNGADGALSFAAAHVAARFVEQQHDFLLGGGVLAVHLDEVARHDAQPGGVDDLAVDFHTAFGNDAIGRAAGFVAAGGEELVESDAALGCRRVVALLCHETMEKREWGLAPRVKMKEASR